MDCIVLNDNYVIKHNKTGSITKIEFIENNYLLNITDILRQRTFETHIFYEYNYQYSFHFSFSEAASNIYEYLFTIAGEYKDTDDKVLYAALPTHLFTIMSVYTEYLITNRKYVDAILFWRGAIDYVSILEKKHNITIHKGTAYGQLARIYIITGDVESAFLLLHNSINEDEKINFIPEFSNYPQNAPSYLTLSLNPSTFNFLHPYLSDIRAYINVELEKYNERYNKKIRLSIFDELFLNNKLLDKDVKFRNIKFLFVFYVWSIIDQSKKYDVNSVKGEFGNIHKLTKILGACVLIDELISYVLDTKATESFAENLRKINKIEKWDTLGFVEEYIKKKHYTTKTITDKIAYITKVLNYENEYLDTYKLDFFNRSYLLLYLLRNISAHSLVSLSILNDKFPEVMSLLFSVLLQVINGNEWQTKLTNLKSKYQ
jgi:hypothetical protein